METIYIYTLSDPITNQIKWVGQTANPKTRFYGHCCNRGENVYRNWVGGLREKSLKPVMNIVDEVSKKERNFWEKHYISLYKSWGFDLLNISLGGVGWKGTKGRKPKKIRKRPLIINPINYLEKKREGVIYKDQRERMLHMNPMKDPQIAKKVALKLIEGKNNKKPVVQKDVDGNVIKKWDSAVDAGRALGLDNTGITKCCKKNIRSINVW